MSQGLHAAHFGRRIEAARAAAAVEGHDALLIGVGPDLEWLTGYAAQGHERLNLLLIPAQGRASFVGPRLELAAALEAPGLGSGDVDMISWVEGDDPTALVAQQLLPTGAARRFAVSDGLRAAFLLGLQASLADDSFEVASGTLSPLRGVKDAEEIELLKAAANAADRVIVAISGGHLVGRTEADIAREVRARLVDAGHETAEFAIVAGGPNSASPHHEPGARVVVAGEPLLFDIGGRRGGYCSDTTRTFWVAAADGSAADPAFVEIHGTVERAQAAGRAAVRPGVAFEDIDAAARDVITRAGHGPDFFHRLGHGIGLEVHEDPYCVSGNTAKTVAGNAFSIEPGIYLEGRYGVRIEDIVVCTSDGIDELNRTPRELLVVNG
jgi:Xaa-Pro aminopeptidase